MYCPHCGKQMSVADAHLGMTIACPHCQGQIDTGRVRTSSTSPPPPPAPPRSHSQDISRGMHASPRSKVVAGLLGLFLGGFGAHRFYLGYMGIGLIQLFLLPLTCGASVLWGFVEGVLCLTGSIPDVDGRPLRD